MNSDKKIELLQQVIADALEYAPTNDALDKSTYVGGYYEGVLCCISTIIDFGERNN